MKQLSGTDNLFLRMERGHQFMHVAGLGIYDPSTAPEGRVRFKDILRFFESRLDASPIFRRRLVTVPFDVDRPVLDRGSRHRRRVPRAPRRVAAPRRLAAALHPGGAHPLAAARPQQAAVGGVRDRAAEQHPRHSARQLRALHQVPPLRGGRGGGHRDPEGDPLDQRRGFQRRRIRRHALPRSRADGARAVFTRGRPWRAARAPGGAILARDRCAPRNPRRGLAGRAAAAARGGRVAEGGATRGEPAQAAADALQRQGLLAPRRRDGRPAARRRCARSASRSRGRRSTTCS